MKSLEITVTGSPQEPVVTFMGVVDENCDFDEIPISNAPSLTFDLSGVRLVNSLGIRAWVTWMKKLAGRAFVFRRCSKPIIDQINALDGFLPRASIVESFYVPYHCAICEHSDIVLFRKGIEFEKGTADRPKLVESPERIECHRCRGVMEMDVIESKYFRFLEYRR